MKDDAERVAIPAGLVELRIDGDLEADRSLIILESTVQAAAAYVTAEQLQAFVTDALLFAGHTTPDRPQTTHTGLLSGTSIRADQFGLAVGRDEDHLRIAFPVGRLTMIFEVPRDRFARSLARFLQGGPLPGPLKPS